MMSITRMITASTIAAGKSGDQAEEDAEDQRYRNHEQPMNSE